MRVDLKSISMNLCAYVTLIQQKVMIRKIRSKKHLTITNREELEQRQDIMERENKDEGEMN
jgi:hypothetical protein